MAVKKKILDNITLRFAEALWGHPAKNTTTFFVDVLNSKVPKDEDILEYFIYFFKNPCFYHPLQYNLDRVVNELNIPFIPFKYAKEIVEILKDNNSGNYPGNGNYFIKALFQKTKCTENDILQNEQYIQYLPFLKKLNPKLERNHSIALLANIYDVSDKEIILKHTRYRSRTKFADFPVNLIKKHHNAFNWEKIMRSRKPSEFPIGILNDDNFVFENIFRGCTSRSYFLQRHDIPRNNLINLIKLYMKEFSYPGNIIKIMAPLLAFQKNIFPIPGDIKRAFKDEIKYYKKTVTGKDELKKLNLVTKSIEEDSQQSDLTKDVDLFIREEEIKHPDWINSYLGEFYYR